MTTTQCPRCASQWSGPIEDVISSHCVCPTCLPRKEGDAQLVDWLQASPNPRLLQVAEGWVKCIGGVSLRGTIRRLMRDCP